MAKRYQPLKEFGRPMKKPKLDVSINKNAGASTSKAKAFAQKSNNDLWDDEEDDVLILATQVAESQIAASKPKTTPSNVDITDSEITFSEFAPKVVQHSTQQPTENLFSQLFEEDDEDIATLAAAIENDARRHEEVKKKLPRKEEDDEEIFKKPAQLPKKTYPKDDTSDDERSGQAKLPVSQFVTGKMLIDIDKPGPSIRKKAIPISETIKTGNKESISTLREHLTRETVIDDDEPGPSTRRPKTMQLPQAFESSRKETKSEFDQLLEGIFTDDDDVPGPSTRRHKQMPQIPQGVKPRSEESNGSDQVKDLLKRLEAMKNENVKLNKDLSSVKETMQTKTGEAAVLRDELRQTKHKLDELKMAKMFQTESMNAETKKQIEELSKKVQDKESELQLKNMECSVLKMRQGDESRRLESSNTAAHDTTMIPDPNDEKTDEEIFDENGLYNNADITMCQPPLHIPCLALLPKEYVFEAVQGDTKMMKQWNRLINKELTNLQLLLSRVQLDIHNVPDETSNEIIESVRKVFVEFADNLDGLNYGFNESVIPEHAYVERNTRPIGCLHFSAPLYPEERVMNFRRFIAILAVMCDRSPDVARKFLAAKHDEKPLLNVAISFIQKIGYSFEVYPFFGVFEAFALVLRTTFFHLNPEDEDDEPYAHLLFKLLKELVFARPGPWAMYELSFSVIDIHERFPSILLLFCENSPPETFSSDRETGVYRFSDKSCFMQVYAGLLESSFPLYVPMTEEIFNLQTRTCLNHIRFVFYCVTEPPEFIEEILSSYEEDDDIDEEYFEDWMKRLCESDEAFNEFFLKPPSPTEAAARKREKKKAAAKAASAEQKTSNVEQPSTNKDAEKSASKEKQHEAGKEAASKSYETFSDEQPTTSRKASEAATKATLTKEKSTENRPEAESFEEKTNTTSGAPPEDTEKTGTQCQCFEQLCLSAVRMIWVSLRQWLRMEKLIELDRVREISRVGVHLVYFLFCDYYLTCLLREDEDTTKHLMYLIYNWWIEHKEDLEFTEIQDELLGKIKNSPIIPKLVRDEEAKTENVAKDYAEWCRLSGLKFDPEALDLEKALKNLRLWEESTDLDKFMEFMEPPNIDMETFEFKGFDDDDDDDDIVYEN